MKQRYVIPTGLIAVSLYWLWMAVTRYGLWVDDGPGGGAMPAIASVVTIVFSLVMIFRKDVPTKPIHWSCLYPVVAIAVVILTCKTVGMLEALFVFLLVWLKFVEKYSWFFSVCLSAGTMVFVWAIFRLWLRVPFPPGITGL